MSIVTSNTTSSNANDDSSSILVDELVNKLSSINIRRIRFIGREADSSTGDHHNYLPEATVYFPSNSKALGMTSYDLLFQTFEIIHDRANEQALVLSSLHDALYLSFSDWDLEEIPPNLGRIMSRVNQCTFINCQNLSSLASIVAQFPNICVLVCRNCPSLTSLSSLKSIPIDSSLYNIAFKDCGLKVTAYDDWEEGLIALGRTRSDMCIMTFQHCPHLTCLPSSIRHLKHKDLTVNFRSNGKLCKLPSELGDIQKIVGLSFIACPRLKELPWSLSRLPDCSLFVSDCGALVGGLLSARTTIALGKVELSNGLFCSIRDHPLYFVHRLKCLFVRIVFLKVFIRRWAKVVIDRMYRPEGKGYHQSKKRFENMVGKVMMVPPQPSSSSPSSSSRGSSRQ